MYRPFLKTAAILGALAVAFGAFGAHSLKNVLSNDALNTFETAVKYQFYHVLALLFCGILYKEFPNKWIKASGRLFFTGIILFSGSLYVLTAFAAAGKPVPTWLGILTPFGGLAFMLGWIFLFIGAQKKTF